MLPVAEIIRTMRREKNVTQDELAQALGVTFQSVSRWENGIAYPDIELIPKIAAFFGITTDRLLGADKENRMRKRIETLQAYNDAYARTDDPHARFIIMKRAYEEFPESEHFASRALTELVYNDAPAREEGLPTGIITGEKPRSITGRHRRTFSYSLPISLHPSSGSSNPPSGVQKQWTLPKSRKDRKAFWECWIL